MKEGTQKQCCCFYFWGCILGLGIPPLLFAATMRERLQKRAGLPATARRSSAEHLIATKALRCTYGLDAHCRSVLCDHPMKDGMVRNFLCHLLCPWCSIAEEARVMTEIKLMMHEEELEEDSGYLEGGQRAPSDQGKRRPTTPSDNSMSRDGDDDDDPFDDF